MKCFFGLLPKEQLSSLIGNLNLEQKTVNTLLPEKHWRKLWKKSGKNKLEQIKREFIEGMVCVAVPIFDRRKRLFATLSVHAPSSRMSLEELSRHVPRLQKASHDLTLITDPGDN